MPFGAYGVEVTTATEFIAAVDAGDTTGVAALLAADPTLAASRGDDGVSAVLHARYRFDMATLDVILAADPPLDGFDAAALGREDVLGRLLAADPALATSFAADGFTALHLAAFFGQPGAARILLTAGARTDVYGTNPLANQPLHAAAAGRHVDVALVLLDAGADVNARQHGGYAPLHEAAASGNVALAALFLARGADRDARTEAGLTPAEVAQAAGHGALAVTLSATGDP
jgi:ankyrin repeat protein